MLNSNLTVIDDILVIPGWPASLLTLRFRPMRVAGPLSVKCSCYPGGYPLVYGSVVDAAGATEPVEAS